MNLLALLLVFGGGILGFLWIYHEYDLYSNSTAIWMGIGGVLLFLLVLFLAYNDTWLQPPGERHSKLIDFLLLRATLEGRLPFFLVLSYLLVLWSLLALILNRVSRGEKDG